MYNPYIGHDSQLFGIEEHRLIGGKGDGMRLFEVKNGKGLQFTVCASRCADIYRLSYKGVNLGYFSPAGYVSPENYDDRGLGFLKSFTAGFMTTCGLTYNGAPNTDEGEELGLHGRIGNTPAGECAAYLENDTLTLRAVVEEARIFDHKMRLTRLITCPLDENKITIRDTVQNLGDAKAPMMMLYHLNTGYPLLSPDACLTINSSSVTPRTPNAAQDLATWDKILTPTPGFQEQCYNHFFTGDACARLVNPKVGVGLSISFTLGAFTQLTQWKMMGVRDYVMGLEPGNCDPDGRANARKQGTLRFLEPGKSETFEIVVRAFDA